MFRLILNCFFQARKATSLGLHGGIRHMPPKGFASSRLTPSLKKSCIPSLVLIL